MPCQQAGLSFRISHLSREGVGGQPAGISNQRQVCADTTVLHVCSEMQSADHDQQMLRQTQRTVDSQPASPISGRSVPTPQYCSCSGEHTQRAADQLAQFRETQPGTVQRDTTSVKPLRIPLHPPGTVVRVHVCQ